MAAPTRDPNKYSGGPPDPESEARDPRQDTPIPQLDLRNDPNSGQLLGDHAGAATRDEPNPSPAHPVPPMADKSFVWDDYGDEHYNRLTTHQGELMPGWSPDINSKVGPH